MSILLMNTSDSLFSLAIYHYEPNQSRSLLQHYYIEKIYQKYSELAAVRIYNLFQKWKINWTDLQHIILNQGPGSFISLRIGLSLVKGFSCAHNIPYSLVSSIKALRSLYPQLHPSLIVHEYRKKFFYTQASFHSSPYSANISQIRTYIHQHKVKYIISTDLHLSYLFPLDLKYIWVSPLSLFSAFISLWSQNYREKTLLYAHNSNSPPSPVQEISAEKEPIYYL